MNMDRKELIHRLRSNLHDAEYFIDAEMQRDAALRPPESQALLDSYVKLRKEILEELAELELSTNARVDVDI